MEDQMSVPTNDVNLVERNPNLSIVNLKRSGKSAPGDLVELARQIQTADVRIRDAACSKLTVIMEQVQFLQQQAQKILEEAAQSRDLHHGAACNFKKVPGKIYHLYERESGQRYFSMLSPQEWGNGLKDAYLNSYRLESDMSWTPVDKIQEQETTKRWANELLANSPKRFNILAYKNDEESRMDE
ncbi:uncharacterized protein C1orf50 homolog [Culicoides brevitarsis]|uniref:uncharacterized protein C1orf50 homolog n=1 Tax=Culicoides brevitarsis TaxID=469753 RepID=UPI00307B92DC